jgi:hypothetical protein
MCCASSDDYITESSEIPPFEKIQNMVEMEFDVKEGFVEHNIPKFYVNYRDNSKQAFLRLLQNLESLNFLPLLREEGKKVVLRVVPKPVVKPSKSTINIVLFLATLGTVFTSGYLYAINILDAFLFTAAIMAILGSHEMGHKLLADKHDVEATYPYFIPGLPPIGTFGALIQQKSLPPNRDALFDIGFTGPITGFIIAVIVTIIGVQISVVVPPDPSLEMIPITDVYPLIYRWIFQFFPPSTSGVITQHPVAFAGWVGMIVTMLNLVPSGMFDGGHVARSLMNDKQHQIVSYAGIILLAIIWWPMAIVALFFSAAKHPGPLDDVSKLTGRRKLGAIVLVVVFILSVVPMGLPF